MLQNCPRACFPPCISYHLPGRTVLHTDFCAGKAACTWIGDIFMNSVDTTGPVLRRNSCCQQEAPQSGNHDIPSGWKQILDLDFIYKWATLLILPAYAITTGIRSQIFVIYVILFVLKVRKSGYVKCGLEYYFAIAMLGLAVSFIGVWDAKILKNVIQVAKILCLPILMCQYKPIRKIENDLALIFAGLGVYGLARMLFAPLVTGYALDRPYCYSDFFMHSSVIAFSGYLFFLVSFVRREGYGWKLFSAVNVLIFAYLILLHSVRASYLAFLILTPVILLIEFKRMALISMACLLVCGAAIAGGLCMFRPEIATKTGAKIRSIVDNSNGSNRGRVVFWKRAIQVFSENPVNGIGYRRFNRRYVDARSAEFDWAFWHAHSEFFSMLAETGLIGVIAWFAFKIRLLVLFFRERRHWIGAFMLYLFLAFEIHNFFECYLYERNAYIYIYVLLGLGINQIVRKRGASTCSAECESIA